MTHVSSDVVEKCMMLLHQVPLLETFEVIMASLYSEFPGEFPVITMRHLRHLTFLVHKQPFGNFVSKFVLDHLNAPALETFRIKSKHNCPFGPPSSSYVSQFIARSHPPIKIMVLKLAINEEDLIGIVRQLPTLKTLFLDNDCVTRSHFLSALVDKRDGSEHVLCPALQNMGFVLYSDDVPLALDIMVSRWPSSRAEGLRRAVLARWKEATQNIKAEVVIEDMALLSHIWEERCESWAAGKGCAMRLGEGFEARPMALPNPTLP